MSRVFFFQLQYIIKRGTIDALVQQGTFISSVNVCFYNKNFCTNVISLSMAFFINFNRVMYMSTSFKATAEGNLCSYNSPKKLHHKLPIWGCNGIWRLLVVVVTLMSSDLEDRLLYTPDKYVPTTAKYH